MSDPVRVAARSMERSRRAYLKAWGIRVDLGDLIRRTWPQLQEERRVSELSRVLGVDRSFLYRVRDGKEWARDELA